MMDKKRGGLLLGILLAASLISITADDASAALTSSGSVQVGLGERCGTGKTCPANAACSGWIRKTCQCKSGYTASGGSCVASCTPSCTGDRCGQSDGCGGTCSSADTSSCGKCGNAACCTDDGTRNCDAAAPACGQTTSGRLRNNCGTDYGVCSKTGAACCADDGTRNCDAAAPACGQTTSGRLRNNCGTDYGVCSKTGAACCAPAASCSERTITWSGNCVNGRQPGTCSDGCSGTIAASDYCRQDFSRNYCVGMEDFDLFKQAFGGADTRFDLSRNGKVDFDDFFLFVDSYGSGCSAPQPQPTSTPSVSLSASSASINSGSEVTLTWATQGLIASCSAAGEWTGAKSRDGGSEIVRPSSTGRKTYTISCFGSRGELVDSKSAAVTVNCVPSCTGDRCGQDNRCGGTCPSDDRSACGKCGNAACCTDNGARDCDAAAPACGQTTSGRKRNNCGTDYGACSRTGDACCTPATSCTGRPTTWSGNCVNGRQPGTCSDGCSGTLAASDYCRQDFSRNYCVGMEDFDLFKPAFGSTNAQFDLSRDGKVEFDDFFLFADAYGSGCSAPQPQPTVTPSVSLSASSASINLGSDVTLTWATQGLIASCSAAGEWIGVKSMGGGSETVRPSSTGQKTYTISCLGSGGELVGSKSVAVTVNCVPSCTGDRCGQDNRCGGACPSDDKSSCGKCGNVPSTYYRDADGDGKGNAGLTMQSCSIPRGYVANSDDCDDNNPSISTVVCGRCGGSTNMYYRDIDGDGYGNPAEPTSLCTQPSGFVDNNRDCYDRNRNIKPGAAELCNNVDDNCDGTVDQFTSTEGCSQRGYCAGSEKTCVSGSWAACSKISRTETCNSIDDDCDGETDEGGICCTPAASCSERTITWSGNCVNGRQPGTCSDGCGGTTAKINIRWNPVPEVGSQDTRSGYYLLRTTNGANGIQVSGIAIGYRETSFIDEVQEGNMYGYKVVAYTTRAQSFPSNEVAITVPASAPASGIPSTVTTPGQPAVSILSQSGTTAKINIRWNSVPEVGSQDTRSGYYLLRTTNGANGIQVSGIAIGYRETSFIDEVQEGNMYGYKVVAYTTRAQSFPSNEVAITVPASAPASGIPSTVTTPGQPTVSILSQSGTLTTSDYCRQDYNRNYCVDLDDFNTWKSGFDTSRGQAGYDERFNLNNVGSSRDKIDLEDFTLFSNAYGSGCSAAQPALTATPSVSLSASSASINIGSEVALTWRTQGLYPFPANGISSCSATGAWTGLKDRNGGSEAARPSSTGQKTYTISCFGSGGQLVDSKSAAVAVNCVDNGQRSWQNCDAAAPRCGQTTRGLEYSTDNCGTRHNQSCTRTGSVCNRAPAVNSQTININEDNPVTITLTGSDPDGDSLSYSFSIPGNGPSNGRLSGTGNSVKVYTPNANFNGRDTFGFKASDGRLESSTATITINVRAVNDAPAAGNVNANVNEDTAADIPLSCSDAESSALSYILVNRPSHGIITSSSGNAKTYDPNRNFNGRDSFTYKCSDGVLDSNIATASITVNDVNDAPAASILNAPYSGNAHEPIDISGSGSDPDGDTSLAYRWAAQAGCSIENPSSASTTAACPQGSYSLTLTVRDSRGAASSPATATINANAKPSVRMDRIGSCRVGQQITLKCRAEDADGIQAARLWAGQCSSGDCFNTRSWCSGSGRNYYGRCTDLGGEPMQEESPGVYAKTLTISQPDGTAIAATCRAQDRRGLWSEFADDYPICVIGGCDSTPSFGTPQATPPHAVVESDVVITFTADRDLSENPTVRVSRGRQQYDAAFVRRDGRSYTYRFRVESSYTAGAYSINVEGTDSNNCRGRANGVLVIRPNPQIRVNGRAVSAERLEINVAEGEDAAINLDWGVNVQNALVVVLTADTEREVARFEGVSGTQILEDIRPGRYIVRLYEVGESGSVSPITGSAITDITGYEVLGVPRGELVAETPLEVVEPEYDLPTGTASPSIYIKMDVSDSPDELWKFKWKGEHHADGGRGGKSERPDHCGLWLSEEDGDGGDNEGWTVVRPGSLIRRDAVSLRDSITQSNIFSCEGDGEDVCHILDSPFRRWRQNKCGPRDCALAEGFEHYKPKGDIICAVDAADGRGKWHLCDTRDAQLTISGVRYFCRVNAGETFGRWLPQEDCTTPEDDDMDGRINCADSECYSLAERDINLAGGELGSHALADGTQVYYHSSCNPDTNQFVCRKSSLIFPRGQEYFEFESAGRAGRKDRPVYGWDRAANACCGDDADDDGVIISNSLCYVRSDGTNQWKPLSSNTGKVFVTNGVPYLAHTAEWLYCEGTEFKGVAGGNSYGASVAVNGKTFVCGSTA